MEDAEALIYKLGGTCQYSGLSGSVKSVYIYGEHHEFSSPYDFAQWVKNDIAPRVLSSNYYNHLCNTGTVKESDGE
jgi:hypothetical protein